MRVALVGLVLAPLVVVGALGYLAVGEMASLKSSRQHLADTLVAARGATEGGGDVMVLKDAKTAIDGALADIAVADARTLRRITWALALVLGLGTILMIAIGQVVRRRVVAPIRHLTQVALKIREGDLDRRAHVATGDELETLGQSINAMLDRLATLIAGEEQKQRLEQNIVRLLEAVSRASEGDLTARGEVSPDELGSVVEAFNHMLASIGRLVISARQGGEEVARSADAILNASHAMAAGAERQALAIDGVSRKIRALGQRSFEITRIVELVDELAAQTNLLALNAAIEASRAGDGGKGFALVADEVRKLAERSAAATRDIAVFIDSIQEATDGAGRAMEEIREVTRRTADGAKDQTQVASQVVNSARALQDAIARFKVRRVDDPTTAAQLAGRLRERREELERALRALASETARNAGPAAAEEVLASFGDTMAEARAQLHRGGGG
jgi:methyl-accepting chemotaxis protein